MDDKRFVLLDRDGTVIREKHYLCDPDGVELLPGAVEGMRAFREMGLGMVLVTNQSGIGRGLFSLAAMRAVHQRLRMLLAREGLWLDGIYYCPHAPGEGCGCRKPLPGMAFRAAADSGFDPAGAFMIGDKPCDIEMGAAAGCATFLTRTGYGSMHENAGGIAPDYVVDGLPEAAAIVGDLLEKPARSFDNVI